MENSKGGGGILAAAVMVGLVDVALVAALALLFLAPRASAARVEASLAADFVENADDYGQIDAGEYPSAAAVTYTGAAPAAQPQQEAPAQQEPAGGNEVEPETGSQYEGFVFPDSHVTELTGSQIAEGAHDAASCRRAINELYARHGYAFSKQENIDFFSAYDWYKNMEKETDMNVVYGRFNAVERRNLEKLQAHEKDNGWN